ncbi:MAG: hypothetical protein ACRC6M_01945 [Microcystaceae cyanobacterium]
MIISRLSDREIFIGNLTGDRFLIIPSPNAPTTPQSIWAFSDGVG